MKTVIFFIVLLGLAAAGSLRGGSCPDACSECAYPFRSHCIECKPGYFLEKGDCRPCHESCQYCNGPFKSDCLPENLHNILNTHRLLSSGDVAPLSNAVAIETGFTLNFDYTPDNSAIIILLNFTLSPGWFGIGFGTSMVNADYVVCIPGNGAISCDDYWSTQEDTPDKDSAIGGIDNVVQLGYDISGGTTLVKFQRKLNTGDAYDNVIVQGQNNMLWAYHATSAQFIFHTNFDSGTVDLTPVIVPASTNSSNQSFTPPVPKRVVRERAENPIERTHGLIIFVGWGLLIDLGLIFMAIGRKYPIYVWIHAVTAVYTIISTIVTSAMMIQYRKTGGPNKLSNSHFGIGVAILALIAYQLVSGFSVIAISYRIKVSNPFYKLRLSHSLNGWLLYILAKTNIFIGVYLYGNTWLVWMIPVEATLIVLNIFVRLWMGFRNKKYQPIYSKSGKQLAITPLQRKLVEDVNLGRSREELIKAYPKIKFAYLFNRIYNLTSFEHPGGNFIISAVKGREIGRFLYGAYQLETLKHTNKYHHKTTEVAILNRYFIGEINQDKSTVLVSKAENNFRATDQFLSWTFVNKTNLTKSIARFEFRNPTFLIKNDIRGVGWFGRHFYVAKDLVKGPIRPYTLCLSLGDSWMHFRRKAVEYFDSKMQPNGEVGGDMIMKPLETYCENLTFVIKKYHNPKSPGLSEYLHTELDETKSILINGPVGTGLELSSASKGTHYIFAVGTGILPFMDLLNFILFKSMYLALKKKYGAKVAQQVNHELADDYENALSGGFKLVIYAAFAVGEESFGYEIIKKAAEIDAKFELNLFEAHIKGVEDDLYVKKITKHIDEQFIRERVNKDGTKFYVCGNPAFNKNIPSNLEKLGVNPLKIMLV